MLFSFFLLEHRRNEEILEEANGNEKVGMVRSCSKKRGNFRAVTEIKMEGKRPKNHKSQENDRNGPLIGQNGKISTSPFPPHRKIGVTCDKYTPSMTQRTAVCPCTSCSSIALSMSGVTSSPLRFIHSLLPMRTS